MKLVAAKCPNCGAQIEVDKNSDSTRCEYCNSKIIVEEALESYKLNKVEVSNLPKYENYIILGDRYYNDKNYKEACEYYGKALELDPNNDYAILRKGFSKSLSSNFHNFDVRSSIQALKNASYALKKDLSSDKYERAIFSCYNIIKDLEDSLFEHYKVRGIERGETEYFNSKLQDCLNGYEYLYSISKNDEMKKTLLNSMIQEIDNIIKPKVYLTGQVMQSGVPSKSFYHMNNTNVSKFRIARQKYVRELNELKNPAVKGQVANQASKSQYGSAKYFKAFKEMSIIDIICFVVGILFFIIAVGTVLSGKFLAYPVCALTGALFLPQIKNIIVKKIESKIKGIDLLINVLRIALIFISIIAIIIVPKYEGEDKPYEGEWESTSGITMTLKDEKIEAKDILGNTLKGIYSVEKDDDKYKITAELDKDGEKEEVIFIFEKDGSKRRFYLEEEGKAALYFVPKDSSSSYKYLTE